jgi:hypothetical protein
MTTNKIRNKRKVGILSAAAALAVAVLMIAYPVVATATPAGKEATSFSPSAAAPPPSLPMGTWLILNSTSGQFWGLNGFIVNFGTASGTMTLTVIADKQANPVSVYGLSVTGWVTIGTTKIPFTNGSASMNAYQTFVVGSGTVKGGSFAFSGFSLGPSVRQLLPLNFSVLSINLHIGGNYYIVLLHVKTTVIATTAHR